jgi:hypothetical protein
VVMVINRVGPPVRGRDCYGRDTFIDTVWEKLSAGHVLLAAPRRFGKTSIMYHLLDQPRYGYKLLHADLEQHIEPAELITQLVTEIAKDANLRYIVKDAGFVSKGFLEAFRKNVDELELFKVKLKLREEIRKDWRSRGDELFARLRAHPGDVAFILDELPMMIDRMARSPDHRDDAITLLRWMRAVRIAPGNRHIHFLVAGSIGIAQVLNGLGEIKSINDFEQLRLEPFSKKTAEAFLDELAASHRVALTPSVKHEMLSCVGILVPYFLQILFSELAKFCKDTQAEPTPKVVKQIYRDRVLGVECKGYFEHYYGRLRDYYPETEDRAIKHLLRELAVQGRLKREYCFEIYRRIMGRSDVDAFNRLMTDLENDFYIRFDFKGYFEFSGKLLRDWWLRHYGLEAVA